jgi:hypothetical protein
MMKTVHCSTNLSNVRPSGHNSIRLKAMEGRALGAGRVVGGTTARGFQSMPGQGTQYSAHGFDR